MKRTLVALGVLAFLASPSWALTLTNGQKEAKFKDNSNLYINPNTDGSFTLPSIAEDTATGGALIVGREQRSIFRTTTITDLDTDVDEWVPTANEELTGLVYDLQLISVTATGVGAFVLDFAPLNRNPLPGTPAGFGGVLETYLDTTPDYNADPGAVGRADALLPTAPGVTTVAMPVLGGPNFWVEGQNTASRDSFVGASGTAAELWLSATFIDFATLGIVGHAPGTVASETFNATTGTGSFTGFLQVLGGSATNAYIPVGSTLELISDQAFIARHPGANLIFNDGDDYLVDTANYAGRGFWQIDSEDPITFEVTVPEPATMSLIGLGLAGIAAYRRRK